MRLWHRVAASRGEGLGHLLRQVAVVEQAVEAGHEPVVVVDDVELARTAVGRFAGLAHRVVPSAPPPGWPAVVAAGDVVVFDGYRFGPDDHAEARRRGAVVVAVDDRGRGRFDVDLLVDHNPTPVAYEVPAGTRVLHGPGYALVRRELLGGRRPTATDHEVLLVAFGGTDAYGLLPGLLPALADQQAFGAVRVLVGPAAAPLSAPEGIEVVRAPDDLAAVHATADAAVVAMGTTLWELLARGVPTAVVALDPLQRRLVDAVVVDGVALDGGDGSTLAGRLDGVVAALAAPELRAGLQAAAAGLVDGRGPGRVVAAIEDLVAG